MIKISSRQLALAMIIVPAIFYLVNYVLLGFNFNGWEFSMIIIISVVTCFQYIENDDYLNPIIYFPILYFLIYWIGNFSMGYSDVPKTMWIYYLIGLFGFYVGAFFANRISVKVPLGEDNDYLEHGARRIFVFIYCICILAKMVIFTINGVPLLASNIDASRQAAAESFGVLKVISGAHTILAVYFFYDLVMKKIKFKSITLLNTIIIACSFMLAILDVSRLLIIQMILPMLFIIIVKVHKIKLIRIIEIALFLLVFIGANKFIRNSLENPAYLAYVTQNRGASLFSNIMLSGFSSFRVAIDDLRLLINTVPTHHGYTYGEMFFNSVFSFLPGKQIVIGYYVADLLGMKFDGMGAATTILGMFYLDGGVLLIFWGMFLFSFFIMVNYRKYIKYSNVTIHSLLSIYIIYYSILCLRTKVMPTIEPLLNMFYFITFSFIAKKIRVKVVNL